MKILFHSNAPWIRTGYGGQTAIWAPRFAALGHEVVISGPFSFAGSPMHWGGFTVLPGAQDPFGSDVIAGHYQRHGCDLMITLCDVFMMNPEAMRGLNVVHWLPVDCDPMGAQDAEKARGAVAVIALTKFGAEVMKKAGYDPFYVPHGIDTQVFSPPADRAALRTEMGLSADDYLVGMNVANKAGPRKAIQEQMIAFTHFREKHPEAKLMMHTFAQPGEGVNIRKLADALGITGSVMLPDQYAYACGMMDNAVLARWYGVLDVYLGATYGEGFGLPLVEAQACGTPVITTDASSNRELCGAGWKVAGEPFWVQGHDSFWVRPSIANILGALESSHELFTAGDDGLPIGDGGDVVTMGSARDQARQFAVQYDADTILEQCWKPVLDRLDEQRPRTRKITKETRDLLVIPPQERVDERRDLLLVIPTRERPENAKRMITAVRATGTARTDVAFGVDGDDPRLDEYRAVVDGAVSDDEHRFWLHVAPRMGLGEWTNELAKIYQGKYVALGSFGDDHEPQTPGWDSELLKVLAVNGPGVVYPNDLVRDDIPEAPVVSAEIIDALGWFWQPSIQHYFGDNAWADLGQYAQCIWYLPDVIVEHVHHLRHPGEVQRDATYQNNELKFAADHQAYTEWRRNGFAADVAKIRAVRDAWQASLEPVAA